MSEIVLVHRIPPQVTPLDEWIPEVADRVTLVTSREVHDQYRDRLPRVVAVDDYSVGPGVERVVDEICSRRPVSALVHVTEDDVLRVARLRDRHDLPGPRLEDVLPWRDKYVMKHRVQAAGVPTAEFAVPRTAQGAHAFARRTGYPVVTKPRLGFGSQGVTVVRDPDELDVQARGWDPDDVLLESFVPGEVYHVDGFTRSGEVLAVIVSRYLNGCLAFQDGLPLGSVQLDPTDEAWPAFAALTERVVAALPPLDFCPFHLEVFRRPDGELVFCEIACRLGGGHIMESVTRATGVNPARLWIRHQVGLEDAPTVPVLAGGKRYGWLLVPPRVGRLVEIRQPQGLDFVTDFVTKTTVPRWFDGAHGSTDSVLGVVVQGRDSLEVEANLRTCIEASDLLMSWETP